MSDQRPLLRSPRYSEGVVLDGRGELFFSMTAISQIARAPRDGGEAAIWAHVPAANGHAIAADGSHLVMASVGAILRLDATGRIAKVLATEAGGAPFVYPNDVALDPQRGGAWCTDSGYQETPAEIDGTPRGRIIRIDAEDRAGVAADGIAYANGVALSPDGRHLYVSESTTKRLWSYPVDAGGALGARQLLAEVPSEPGVQMVPDGISVARDGRLFVAHYGAGEVLVYLPDGTLQRRIPCGNRVPSHVALDLDHRRLYVSGGIEDERGEGAIFAIDL